MSTQRKPETKKHNIAMLAAVQALGFAAPTEPQLRRNPFNGKSHILEPQAVMLYDFITTKDHVCGLHYTRRNWDLARYFFAEKWPDQYFDLLD